MPEPPTSELILVNLGTPTAPTSNAVRAFLAEFLGDPMVVDKPRWLWLPILHAIILRRRPTRIAEAYAKIWGSTGSPLAVGTAALAKATDAATGPNISVTHAFRYGTPNLKTRLVEALAAHPNSSHPIHVIPLFPQRTASSSETIVRLARQFTGPNSPTSRVKIARLTPTSPSYIAALASDIKIARERTRATPTHLVVSFHGIPQSVNRNEDERYTQDCQATFAALLAATGTHHADATLTFQSRFGREPWISPATNATLASLARNGTRSVVVCAPGFLTAGLETIEELGIRARADFHAAGGQEFELTPALVQHGDPPHPHPSLVAYLAQLTDQKYARAEDPA